MCDTDWGYALRCEPQTQQRSFNFYRCCSCTIQQVGRSLEREKQGYVLLAKPAYMQRWYVVVVVFSLTYT